jgi:hypothetical protein
MAWPIVGPAPVVTDWTWVFRDLFAHPGQFRHVQHDLTGRSVLPHQSLANRARGILDSADKTNLARLRAEAPWREDEVHHRRIRFMRQPTTPYRRHRRDSLGVIDDTLGDPVGSRLDHVDRHDHHGEGPSSLRAKGPESPASARRPGVAPGSRVSGAA